MTTINRRRILTSLAGGAAVASVPMGISSAAMVAPGPRLIGEEAESHEGWLIAQHSVQHCGEHAVKFWSA